MTKYIFKADDIEINKPKIFNVPRKSIVIIDHFHFTDNLVSRIEVEKIEQYQDTIFINLYSGNLQIGDIVAKNPYVLDISNAGNVQVYYDLRLATELDKED